jgi:putative transposase
VYQKKQNTFIVYWLWIIFLFFGTITKKNVRKITCFIKRNHVSIWNWLQKYKPQRISTKRKKVIEYIIDEIVINVGSEFIWLWVAIEPIRKEILGISISIERNMFVAERFISKLIKIHGPPHPVSTTDDGGTWYPPQACRSLKLSHHIHSFYQKSIIERTMQYIKDRTKSFDDYFPCRKKKCKLTHDSLVESPCEFP